MNRPNEKPVHPAEKAKRVQQTYYPDVAQSLFVAPPSWHDLEEVADAPIDVFVNGKKLKRPEARSFPSATGNDILVRVHELDQLLSKPKPRKKTPKSKPAKQSNSPTTLAEVDKLLGRLRTVEPSVLTPPNRTRHFDTMTKVLSLKHRIEQAMETSEDRMVRESPFCPFIVASVPTMIRRRSTRC